MHKMIEIGCPECGSSNIELYDQENNKGKYRCKDCGRDTFWAIGKSISFTDVLNKLESLLSSDKD